MLKIRLMRIGAKKRPFYRVVVIDERSKRSGEYIELLGTYNPLTKPHEINLKQDRIDHWIKQGAQMSDGYLRIIGKAPQRPARKPKKEKKEAAPAAVPTPIESEPTEKSEPTVEETPAEIPTKSETTPKQTELTTEETKSGLAEANGAAEPTPEANESTIEEEAKPTLSEQTESLSDASQPDEPTPEKEPTPEEK